ncbi:MAG: response regulator, partial [Saprospiraceae bacterium]|nr:response regulator [Saprospiraceae bacterium]
TYEEFLDIEPAIPVLEDSRGRIWFFNSLHLIRYDPNSKEVAILGPDDGLPAGFYWTGHQAKSGQLFMGGIEGLTIFHPDSIQTSYEPPRTVITDFRLFNKTVPLAGSRADTLEWASPLAESIIFTNKIRLKHWQNYFSLEFAALDLTSPATNRYQYQLVGYDEDWLTTDAKRRYVTYTNLDPGTYTFRVRGATRKSTWSTSAATVEIRILAPWWATIWAYTAYALLLFAILRTIYIFQLRRKVAQAEAEQFKELDAVKTKLYTNITHEFRTPLTVILGMAGKVEEDPKKWLGSGIDSIKRNGQRLLHLVNQMLDLSRLELGKLALNMHQGDVIPFVSYLVQSYESYAESKGIQLRFEKSVNSLVMDHSADALSKIISNLISNALKHTPDGGRVTVGLDVQDNQLLIEVIDTGVGIPEDHLSHIFDQFYQVDSGITRETEGTGIGLALVKELVDRLKGDIKVSSQEKVGTQFKVLLPISRKAEMKEPVTEMYYVPENVIQPLVTKDVTIEPIDNKLPLILLVEDNEDVAAYISSCLVGRFQVIHAHNGKVGVEKALKLIPDLIICDVMMPEMDGYQVCQLLKQDERSSHVPIVMLTAKADADSRLQGLRQGADAYLAKPFQPEELDLRLNNLLYLRGQIQSHFGQFPSNLQDANHYPQEHEFLSKVKSKILEHLASEDFGIPELCLAIGLSRSQLHRKLKAITGKSTSLIIRGVRMNEARKLLHSDLTISEIAYEVGYSSPNYFSTMFSESFGISPTEMRDKNSMQQ